MPLEGVDEGHDVRPILIDLVHRAPHQLVALDYVMQLI